MDLIDKQDDVGVRYGFIEHVLDTFFEVSSVLGACDHGTDLHAVNDLALNDVRHVAVGDLKCQTFCDRGLADARITYEAGIVLRSADQDLHDTVDLFLTAYYGIDLARLGKFGKILAELFEGLVSSLAAFAGLAFLRIPSRRSVISRAFITSEKTFLFILIVVIAGRRHALVERVDQGVAQSFKIGSCGFKRIKYLDVVADLL